MNMSKEQITFRRPLVVSACIDEGLRALAENYDGRRGLASDYCVNCITGLTEARLTSMRGTNPPGYTRDGQIFISLIWVLLVDGMLVHRPHEAVVEWLAKLINATDLLESDLDESHLSFLTELFAQAIAFAPHVQQPTRELITETMRRATGRVRLTDESRSIPAFNRIFLGRDQSITELKVRLGVLDKSARQPLTIIRGWPGVGKTAIVNAIAHDSEIRSAFQHGLLWMNLGPNSDIFGRLKAWARELGATQLLAAHDMATLFEGMRKALRGKDILILVDDVWHVTDGNFMKGLVDLKANTVVFTTRFTDLAVSLRDLREDVYILEPLSESDSIDLLKVLAPTPASIHHDRLPQLVRTVEGLPLALRVAGPLLQHYSDMGFDVDALLDEFERDHRRLLESVAPADRFDERTGRTPTIELLFQRSVETLPSDAQVAFVALGVFEHKPATFSFDAMREVWDNEDPHSLISVIVGRGLLESMPDTRFRMHQTLHAYANLLLDRYDKTGRMF